MPGANDTNWTYCGLFAGTKGAVFNDLTLKADLELSLSAGQQIYAGLLVGYANTTTFGGVDVAGSIWVRDNGEASDARCYVAGLVGGGSKTVATMCNVDLQSQARVTYSGIIDDEVYNSTLTGNVFASGRFFDLLSFFPTVST